jgi:stage II sporulation protein D
MFKQSTIHKTIAKNKRKRMKKLQRKNKRDTSSFILKKQYRLKWPGTVILGMMLLLMLFIPTVIVMLPKTKSPPIESEEVTSQADPSAGEIEMSNVEVAIKRTASEKIEKVPLEEYVVSVVASEMPAEFEMEALKAQAIAARTYVVNHLLHNQDDQDTVMTDTEEHQVYQNEEELKERWGSDFHWKFDKINNAVTATANEIITYDEEPITPTFFSMSNGYTEDAKNYWGNELPYLKSVESKWEESNPNFTEQTIFTLGEVNSKIGVNLQPGSEIPMQIKRTPSNRVSEVNMNGTTLTGREVREKLGLRSNDFSIQQRDDHLIFTTKGFGHGVGMSQYGANGMAQEGKTYAEIIQYYYQDVEITSIKQAAPTLVSK